MTEALRPPRAAIGGSIGGSIVRPAAIPTAAVAGRRPEARRPDHLGVLLGISAAAYAVSLAGVTGLQSAADQAAAGGTAPVAAAIASARTTHDTLERQVAAADDRLVKLGATYAETASRLSAYQDRVDALASSVATLEGTTLKLPTRISLPSAPRIPSVSVAAPKPAAHATTGASGAKP